MARRIAEGRGCAGFRPSSTTGRAHRVRAPWRFSAVKQILTNPRIAGLRHSPGRGRRRRGVADPIIDRATWDELQAILTDPRRKQARPARYLLTGLVDADEGDKMTGARRAARPAPTGGASTRAGGEHRRRPAGGVRGRVRAGQDRPGHPTQSQRKTLRVPSEVAPLERELEELAGLRGGHHHPAGVAGSEEAARRAARPRLGSKVPAAPASRPG